MPELQPLSAAHAVPLLAFEQHDRGYFTEAVGDRGDEFFERFDDVLATRLAEQSAGTGAYFVLVEDNDTVVGRVNQSIDGNVATLGYRLAERVTGHGLATRAVRSVCEHAGALDVRTVVASVAEGNPASRRVLVNTGSRPAAAVELPHGGAGVRYERQTGKRS